MQYVSLADSLYRLGVMFLQPDLLSEHDAPDPDIMSNFNPVSSDDTKDACEQELLKRISSFEIDLIGTVALLIKAQWERYQNLRAPDKFNFAQSNAKLPQEFEEQPGFILDTDALYLLLGNAGILKSSGYNEPAFKLLCREIVSARLFWGEINGSELEAFRRREEKNRRIFFNATEDDIQLFQQKKLFWLEVYDQLGEKILLLEQIKLRREEVNRRFMVEFGEAHLVLEEQVLRLEKFGLLVDFCRSNPEASRDDIEKVIASRTADQEEQLRQLKHAVFMAPYLEKGKGGISSDVGEFINYREKVKRRLLEIRMILHPDRLVHHPLYMELSNAQKERLAELWHRLQEVTPDETGYMDDHVGGILRSLTLLDNILNEAKAILACPGIDTNTQLIPQGDTLDEQIAWLNTAIEWIDGQTISVIAEVYAQEQDVLFKKREILLSCTPEKKTQVRKDMETLAKEYYRDANGLEVELERLLAEAELDQVGWLIPGSTTVH